MAAQADRATNKAINSMSYAGDFLQSIENGTLKLEDVRPEELPEELRNLSPAERKQEIEKRQAQRRQIRAEIMQLSKDRAEFIKKERAKSGVRNSFRFGRGRSAQGATGGQRIQIEGGWRSAARDQAVRP